MDKNISDGLPLPQRYGAILTIVLGLAMAVLDGAIANVALPTIASDLNASPASSIWIVNAYQIAIVIALLPLSFLGDMVGYRRIYKIGLVLFTFTSLACALSRSLEMLTLARVAQGLGGAALMSVNRADSPDLSSALSRPRDGDQLFRGGRLLRGGADHRRRDSLNGFMAMAVSD